MKKRIELSDKNIEYTLKLSNRSKRVRIAIYCDGNFVVTAPQSASQNLIEQFIVKKSQWIIDKIAHFKNFKGSVIPRGDRTTFLQHRDKAMAIAQSRIGYFNEFYGFGFNKINIKNQKTRWGSCSRRGNINFNYKIALLPSRLADYIVVHELCHLGEFNHSQKFWNLVAKTTPDYVDIRKELKKIMVMS